MPGAWTLCSNTKYRTTGITLLGLKMWLLYWYFWKGDDEDWLKIIKISTFLIIRCSVSFRWQCLNEVLRLAKMSIAPLCPKRWEKVFLIPNTMQSRREGGGDYMKPQFWQQKMQRFIFFISLSLSRCVTPRTQVIATCGTGTYTGTTWTGSNTWYTPSTIWKSTTNRTFLAAKTKSCEFPTKRGNGRIPMPRINIIVETSAMLMSKYYLSQIIYDMMQTSYLSSCYALDLSHQSN